MRDLVYIFIQLSPLSAVCHRIQVGGYHEFSAGLLLGGKNVHEEKEVVSAMNILVATPGRLLQHLDEAVGFDATSLQVTLRRALKWALYI